MDLSTLVKKTHIDAPMLTIVGTPGVGKSTLAAMFPNVIFVQAENSGAVFDMWDDDVKPMLLPRLPRAEVKDGKLVVSTKAVLLDQLRALATQKHDYKTVVLDAATSLHALFEHELCVSYGVTNIGEAAGGYGKGFDEIKEMHSEVKDAFDYLCLKKGITVIFLAHADIRKIKNRPDADEYTIFTLGMHEKSIPTYTNFVDAVLYLRQEEFVKGVQSDKKGNTTKFGKLVQSADRVLVTSGDGRIGYANAKNRFDFEPEIAVEKGENPLLSLIPFYQSKPKSKTKAAAITTTTEGEAQ